MNEIGTFIFTSYDSFEVARIVAAFEDAGIPVYTREEGIGQLFRIYTGGTRTGTMIFVPEEAADQALDILVEIGLIEA